MAEHHSRNDGMGENGYNDPTERGRPQGVGIFFRAVVMGPLGGNGEEGEGVTHWVTSTDHGEASELFRRQDMGDAQSGRSTEG